MQGKRRWCQICDYFIQLCCLLKVWPTLVHTDLVQSLNCVYSGSQNHFGQTATCLLLWSNCMQLQGYIDLFSDEMITCIATAYITLLIVSYLYCVMGGAYYQHICAFTIDNLV